MNRNALWPTLVVVAAITVSPKSWAGSGLSPAEVPSLIAQEFRRPVTEAPPYAPVTMGMPYKSSRQLSVDKTRLALWLGLVATTSYVGYGQSQASWGASNGRFHFKDELHDGLALSDEVSHLFASYQLTRVLHEGYEWTGVAPTYARRIAAAHAWLWTLLVEYPIDAYNPGQGLGLTDLAFNTAGIIAAYQQTSRNSSPWWDIKISVKRSFFKGESRVIARDNEQYDDYIYWLTIRPRRTRFLPIWLGAGYATNHVDSPSPEKELHLGIGTTVGDIMALVDGRAAGYLRPLGFLFLNVNKRIAWRQ